MSDNEQIDEVISALKSPLPTSMMSAVTEVYRRIANSLILILTHLRAPEQTPKT